MCMCVCVYLCACVPVCMLFFLTGFCYIVHASLKLPSSLVDLTRSSWLYIHGIIGMYHTELQNDAILIVLLSKLYGIDATVKSKLQKKPVFYLYVGWCLHWLSEKITEESTSTPCLLVILLMLVTQINTKLKWPKARNIRCVEGW